MDRWKSRVAVVTGASAGIGRAICKELLLKNIVVVGLARRPELVELIKNDVPSYQASNLFPIKCDISNEQEVEGVFQWIKVNLKAVHIIINNAGILTKGSILDGPIENWRKTLEVNVIGLCLVTKTAFKLMKEKNVEDGHIININSIAGHKVPDPSLLLAASNVELNVYPASKHAVTALTETLLIEIRSKKYKTKITSISPGLVKTEIFQANQVDPSGKVYAMPALDPKDVANAVLYVLGTPPSVNIKELTIQPVGEPF